MQYPYSTSLKPALCDLTGYLTQGVVDISSDMGEPQWFTTQQAGKFCIAVIKSFTVTGRTLSHKLMTWTQDAFNERRANAPFTSLEHLVGVPLNRDYRLGTTRLDRYEAKISHGRQTTRTVNEILLDGADPLNLAGEAGVDVVQIASRTLASTGKLLT